MRGTLTGFISRRQKSRDDGFSLIELIIAVFIIGGVLLALVALQTRAMVSIAQAKERQQATAIANEVLEQLRALPWKTITQGPNAGAYAHAPYVSEDKLSIPGEPIENETLKQRDVGDPIHSGDPAYRSPLDGNEGSNLTIHTDPALGFEFRAYSYVTQKAGADSPYNLTVVVEWEARGKGEERRVIARTTAFNTGSGCGAGSETRPFATACQDFFVAKAGVSAPSISVSGQPIPDLGADPADPLPSGPYEILPGSGVTEIYTIGSSTGVTIDSAQSTAVRSSASKGSISVVDIDEDVSTTSIEDVLVTASDSVTANHPSDESRSLDIPNLSERSADASGMKLIVNPGSRNGGVSSHSTNACGSWAVPHQPCGFGLVTNGQQQVTLNVEGEPPINLLAISSVTLEAQAGRYPGGSSAPSSSMYCSVLSGSGCTGSKARTSTYNASFAGVAELTGFGLDRAIGRGAALTSGNEFAPGRAGSLIVDGLGSVDLNPSNSETHRVNDPDDPIEVFNDGVIVVTAVVDVYVDPPAAVHEGADSDCRTVACSGRVELPPVRINVVYTVTNGSDQAAFAINVSLGETHAAASYTAAPEAWEDD